MLMLGVTVVLLAAASSLEIPRATFDMLSALVVFELTSEEFWPTESVPWPDESKMCCFVYCRRAIVRIMQISSLELCLEVNGKCPKEKGRHGMREKALKTSKSI